MKTCAFFGHSEVRENIDFRLTNILIDLIENEDVSNFYVGNHGAFDRLVTDKLRDFKKRYPHIKYSVVLAYLPSKETLYKYKSAETIYPEGLESALPKYAIIKRNQWMIKQADVIVTYVRFAVGGAAKAKEYAEQKSKRIINISD